MSNAREELADIERIATSPSMVRLTDTILRLDRRDVSRLITAYFYFRSAGKSNREFLLFIATSELRSTLSVGLNVLPSLLIGLLGDKDFRMLILSSLGDRTQDLKKP